MFMPELGKDSLPAVPNLDLPLKPTEHFRASQPREVAAVADVQ